MADVGARLRAARERKGIPLKNVAAATKISLHTLEALERNDTSRLPGGIFSRSFVRSYALEVGLDPDEILKEFLAQSVGEPSVSLGVPYASSTSHGPGVAPGTRALVADEEAFESQRRMAAVAVKLVLISLAVCLTILYFSLQRRPPGIAVEHPTGAGEAPTDVQGTPSPGAVASGPAEETPPAGALHDTRPAAAIADAPAADPLAADLATTPPVRLEIVPTRECWVKLTADGEVVLSRVLAAGEREVHAFRHSAVLQVGDAEACVLSIDGRPARALGNPRQVRQVVLTRENYRGFLQ